jgi:hypothetical protein
MTAPPIPMLYEGAGLWRTLRRAVGIADHHFGVGEVVLMAQLEERSEASHRQEFAWLRDAWATLPDHIAADYPSPEHLRKRALIATGWCNVRDYPCASRAEARRLRATLASELDDYTVIVAVDDVVRVCRAKSQARNKMKAADFQASKTAVLEWVAALLHVEPRALEHARAA